MTDHNTSSSSSLLLILFYCCIFSLFYSPSSATLTCKNGAPPQYANLTYCGYTSASACCTIDKDTIIHDYTQLYSRYPNGTINIPCYNLLLGILCDLDCSDWSNYYRALRP